MLSFYQARVGNVRALSIAVVFGCLLGLAVGGAYLSGHLARQAVERPSGPSNATFSYAGQPLSPYVRRPPRPKAPRSAPSQLRLNIL